MTSPFAARDVFKAAWDYAEEGFSVIPCQIDKRPAIKSWSKYQTRRAAFSQVYQWFSYWKNTTTHQPGDGHQSIGFVLGEISHNVVVIDLDGVQAMKSFYRQFPTFSGMTLTVLTGSGAGCHLYFRVSKIPDNTNVRVPDVGGFEIRGNGQYVIAPPSPHPSGRRYETVRLRAIADIPHLDHVRDWMLSLKANQPLRSKPISRPATLPRQSAYVQTVYTQELTRVRTAGFGERNNCLFEAALRLANFAASGSLDWNQIESELLAAATSTGLGELESQRTIQSAKRIGWKNPRTVPKG